MNQRSAQSVAVLAAPPKMSFSASPFNTAHGVSMTETIASTQKVKARTPKSSRNERIIAWAITYLKAPETTATIIMTRP